MQTKLKVEINSKGNHLTDIVMMVASHNSGVVTIDLDAIAGYLLAEKAKYPVSNEKLIFKIKGDTLFVSDNNEESYYLSITECEVIELVNEPV